MASNWFSRAAIRTKLSVVILSATLLIVGVGFLIELAWDFREFRHRAVSTGEGILGLLDHDLVQLSASDPVAAASATRARIAGLKDVEALSLHDSAGNALFVYEREHGPVLKAPDWRLHGVEFEGDSLHLWRPVPAQGSADHTVYLRVSLRRSWRDLAEHVETLALAIPAILLFAIWIALRSQGYFTRPLLELHEAVRRVSETQDYSTRVSTDQKNEIGRLFDGFNAMLEKIEQSSLAVDVARQALKESNQQLEYLAIHDSLTGLINRREFERRLDRALSEVKERRRSHVLLYLDLDQFKVVNDTCGHFAGDELLRQVTGVLQTRLRHEDTLGRLGGDEFGVLLSHCSEQQGYEKAVALSRAMHDFRFGWEGKIFPVGVSIGVVSIAPLFSDVTALLRAADNACYAAKDSGRNRIHLFREDDEHIVRQQGQMRWVARVRQALDEGRMRLYLQRIRPAQPGRRQREHYEVLLRMVDERGMVISPESFVPAAERYGLITRLDRWVVGTLIDWLTDQRRHARRVDLFSVNLSGPTLADDSFRRFLSEKFERSGVPPERFCFEITETAAITNLAKAISFMSEMKARGCRFALDDFGSGVSSFGYLKQLPVDMLKIDGVFVKDMLNDPIGEAMVKSINDIGHAMGLETIAEYVGSEELQARVVALGVDYVQGHAVAEPIPLEKLRYPELVVA